MKFKLDENLPASAVILTRGGRALFRKHGFAPQTAGGWARGDWIQTRADDRHFITERSRQWLAGQDHGDRDS